MVQHASMKTACLNENLHRLHDINININKFHVAPNIFHGAQHCICT